MPPEYGIKVKNERAITLPVPASAEVTEMLAEFAQKCHEDGFVLKNAQAHQGGSQYDPYVTSFTLTFEKKA